MGSSGEYARRKINQGIPPGDIYWTNHLGCYTTPKEYRPEYGTACLPRVRSLYRIIKPKLIIVVGWLAARAVLQPDPRYWKAHHELKGIVHTYETADVITIMHPHLIRRASKGSNLSTTNSQIKAKEDELDRDLALVFQHYDKITEKHLRKPRRSR